MSGEGDNREKKKVMNTCRFIKQRYLPSTGNILEFSVTLNLNRNFKAPVSHFVMSKLYLFYRFLELC